MRYNNNDNNSDDNNNNKNNNNINNYKINNNNDNNNNINNNEKNKLIKKTSKTRRHILVWALTPFQFNVFWKMVWNA